MTIFAIVGTSDPTKLKAALEVNFTANFIEIPSAAGYFVAASPRVAATAKDISDQLGITDGTNGSGIVLNIGGYFGRSNPQVWEWIAAKMRQVE